jgi:hypothetical protein
MVLLMSHYIKVYHISPHANIQQFKGNYSPKMKARGIFVSESWQSILSDWVGTLSSKRFGKRKPSTLEKRKRRLQKFRDTFKEEDENSEEYQLLSEQISRYWRADNLGQYRNLTFYTLLIPKTIFEICKQRIIDLSETAISKSGMGAYGAWMWGVETFILEEYLDQIKIIGRKTYPIRQALELSNKNRNVHQTHYSNIYQKMMKYEKEIKDLIQKFGNAPLLNRALQYVLYDKRGESTDVINATRHYKIIEDLIAPYKQQKNPDKEPHSLTQAWKNWVDDTNGKPVRRKLIVQIINALKCNYAWQSYEKAIENMKFLGVGPNEASESLNQALQLARENNWESSKIRESLR